MFTAKIRLAAGNLLLECKKELTRNWCLYVMLLPVIAYFLIFHYIPLIGAQIAFRNYRPGMTMWEGEWIGLTHFKNFVNSFYFVRLFRNTLLISVYDILYGFPAPILLALVLNEVRNQFFKRTVQTITYLPHFVSIVVVSGMIIDFFGRTGIVNTITGLFGIEPVSFMTEPSMFRPIFVGSNIWQQIGWGSIVYLAALSAVDQELYEAATIDGAKRFKQLIYITLPSITPTIIIMFILRIGRIMTVGYEKVMLLYNQNTYETADVISSYVYRSGIIQANYSSSTAISLFNSVINLFVLVSFNAIARKMSDTSLW